MNEIGRFWRNVHKTDDGCWLWTASLNSGGYSKFYAYGRQTSGHQFSFREFVGPIPDGMHLDHLCRNRACVNPAHLEPVSNRENLLRGPTLAAENSAKTHCPQGHPYEGDNLLVSGGRRICRTCSRRRTREWKAQQRKAA